MDYMLMINCHSNGRDKLARLLQYTSRTVWFIMENKRCNEVVENKFRFLDITLGTFRQILRFGMFVDSFYLAFKNMKCSDLKMKTYGNFFHALYLLCDHVLLLDKLKIIHVNSKQWTSSLNRFWLCTSIVNIIQELYFLLNYFWQNVCDNLILTFSFICNVRDQKVKLSLMNVLRNFCDILIQLTSLGFLRLNPGVIGVLGIISSVAGPCCLFNGKQRLKKGFDRFYEVFADQCKQIKEKTEL